jgi:chromate transporter
MSDAADAVLRVPFATALRFWLKLGFISFGGPAGQIAIMHEELVVRRRWIGEPHFLHALNFCMLLPGPEAQQLATYLGWRMHGVRGGLAAGGLFVLPSLVMMIGLAWLYLVHGATPLIAGVLAGIKATVIAIVLMAAWRIGRRSLRNAGLVGLAVFGCAARVAGLPFPLIIALAALAGCCVPGLRRGLALEGGRLDGRPSPVRAPWRRAGVILISALALWAGGFAALALQFGWSHAYAQMAWFFTKAALLTFGGAYAVLPYVFDGAVTQYGWLSPAQMIDGLALGETTPGPLIMIVAFVGFLGGWQQQLMGADHTLLAGVCGAVVATGYTFLPSFLFILGGAPVVEFTRSVTALAAPLAAISAAVVGVIVHLGLFLAGHVLWPGHPDWQAIAIALGALAALAAWRRSLLEVVIVAGIAGCALRWLAGA